MPLFDDLDAKVIRAAGEQGVPPDALRDRICSALVAAARDHFGHAHAFEARFEGGTVQLAQAVRVRDEPSGPGEVATARARARELDVQDGDELAFEVAFTDPRQAAAQDREWGWLSGLVTERSGFGGVAARIVREALRIATPHDPDAEAARRAVLLAVLPAGAPAERMRVVQGPHGGLQLRRSFVVGRDASRDELLTLLERADAPDGSAFELFEDLVMTERLLTGLTDPGVRAIARTASELGVSEADVISALKAAGLDLSQRRLEGRPWTNLDHAMKHSWMQLKVVDHVRAPYGEITLAHAKLIDPSLELGQQLKLPGGIDRSTCPDLVALFADEDTVRFIDTRGVESFEKLRPTVAVQPTPPALRSFGLGPLRRLYPEDHGVLYADVPGHEALALWKALDAAAIGFRPVLLGGDSRELRASSGAWSGDSHDGLQAGTHPNDSPQAVLAAAETVDVAALLAPGANPSYPGLMPERGEWPDGPSGDQLSALRDPLTKKVWPSVRLALVPVDAAWKTLAYLPMLLQAGEATPSLAQACAVSREWEQKFGAKVRSLRPATIEWWLARPPSRQVALELAPAHFTFTPEGGSGVLEVRANELVSPVWSAWWD